MGVIRWEQDQYDGDLVDVWVGWLGRVNICLVKFQAGGWHLRMYDSFPGARKIADDHIAAWLDLRELEPKAVVRTEADFRNADIDANGSVTFNRPIRPTAEDVQSISTGTARQILEHNRMGQDSCGWHP